LTAWPLVKYTVENNKSTKSAELIIKLLLRIQELYKGIAGNQYSLKITEKELAFGKIILFP